MIESVPALGAIIGLVVLFLGRKLFWLCVAAVGFAAGVEIAPHVAQQPTPVLQLSIAIVLGFVGALLALLLQKVAVALVGFAAGGRLAVGITGSFFVDYANYYWLTFILGGVVGALLLLALFDWAVIIASTLIGAHLVVRAFVLPQTGATILLVVLAAIGVVVQASLLRRRRAVAD